VSRLEGIYKIMNIDIDEQIYSRREIDDVLDLYLTTYLRGGNLSANGPEQALLRLSIFRTKYQGWNSVKEWVNNLVENMSAISIPANFAQFSNVAEALGENFASFNAVECEDLKRALLAIEDPRQGRVNISTFYKMGLHSHWKFTEKVDYLKSLGALDDSDPLNPAVIVSNYIISKPNCLDASNFYSICCRNECDDLLAILENDIQGPFASPDKLINLVSKLASDTVTAPRQLSPTLITRLHQVADTHDIHQITLRYLDSSDDVINDSTISGSRKASGGVMQLIFHLVNCFMIGYFLYDMVSQLMSFHKITLQQINSHYVCTQINRSISTTYRLYFANFTFFSSLGHSPFHGGVSRTFRVRTAVGIRSSRAQGALSH